MALFGAITNALFRPSSRAIDIIIPDVVFEESHRDELIITQHPVEKGAAITDHAFKRPAELEMRCGWSDSTAGYAGYSRQVYDRLLALQAERRPFKVYTGKRRYQDMLIRGVALTTDPKSEFAALIVVALQEVILTSTRSTGGQQQGDTATPGGNENQANPSSTGAVESRGEVSGSNVGSQSFAGAYNPGNGAVVGPGGFQVEGSAATGSLGLGGINPGATTAIDPGAISGISPPTSITLPELSVTTPSTIGGLQGAGPDQYNMFGAGP